MPSAATVERCCWFDRSRARVNDGSMRAVSPGAQTRRPLCPFKTECEMSLVYVFAASGLEANPVRKLALASGSNSTLRCGLNDLVLITSGMGPANARKNAEAALMSSLPTSNGPKPNAVLIIGLCGGLTPSLPERRIVAYTECRATDANKPLLRCSEPITNTVVQLMKRSSTLCDRVVGITSPNIATTPGERRSQSTAPLLWIWRATSYCRRRQRPGFPR